MKSCHSRLVRRAPQVDAANLQRQSPLPLRPPSRNKQSSETRPRETRNQDHHSKQNKPAQHTPLLDAQTRFQFLQTRALTSLVALGKCRRTRRLCTMARTPHQSLLRLFVDEVMNAQFQVWSMELRGQRRKLPFARNRSPRRPVDRIVMRRAIEPHPSNSAIRQNRKPDQSLTLFRKRRLRLLRDKRKP